MPPMQRILAFDIRTFMQPGTCLASRIIFPGDEICYWYGMTCSEEGEDPVLCLCLYCQDPSNPPDRLSGGYLCAPFGY